MAGITSSNDVATALDTELRHVCSALREALKSERELAGGPRGGGPRPPQVAAAWGVASGSCPEADGTLREDAPQGSVAAP